MKIYSHITGVWFSIVVLAACLLSCGAGSKNILSNEQFMKMWADSTMTNDEILERVLYSVVMLSRVDSAVFYGIDTISFENDRLMIGRWGRGNKIIAIDIPPRDSVINFHLLQDDHWKLIGRCENRLPDYWVQFEDLDGDGVVEYIISTWPNINGNMWKEVYYYSQSTDSVHYAGSFSTEYTVDRQKGTIEEDYECTMGWNPQRTLYEWRDEMIVPMRRIVLISDDTRKSASMHFDIYENETGTLNGLKLKKTVVDNGNTRKKYWDNFFVFNK